MAGAERTSALLQSVIIGATNLVFTMVAMTVIDRFGRRVEIRPQSETGLLDLDRLLATPTPDTAGSAN